MRDLYKVLGIASTADDLRIKSAFRRRALRIHPDLNPGADGADERFRELLQAYEVLRDGRARAAYDAHLARQRSQTRRRFMQSAAVMVVTFVVTTSSAIFVAGLQGINVHSETWQIATAWLTSVEVEPSTPGRLPVTEAAKAMPSATTAGTEAAKTTRRPPQSSKAEPAIKAQSKPAPRKVAGAANDSAQPTTSLPW